MARWKLTRSGAVLAVLAGLAVGCESAAVSEDGDVDLSPVVGGAPTNYAEYQGVVALTMGHNQQQIFCTGTLIDERVVLSAGHCVLFSESGYTMDLTQRPGRVRISGGAEIPGSTVDLAGVTRIIPFPAWTGDLGGGADLSLLFLDQDVTSVPFYKMRDFPQAAVGDAMTIVGYGEDENGVAGIHRKGQGEIREVFPDGLEYGVGATSCFGDSGGPVFTQQNGEWVVSGVVSFGVGEQCFADQQTYGTNVLLACDWLNRTMLELVGHDLGLAGCRTCDAKPVAAWGQGCGDGLPECPAGTQCYVPADFNGVTGYCAAPCCTTGTADATHCIDVAPGTESCMFNDLSEKPLCAVLCETSADCPKDTICRSQAFEDLRICIHVAGVSAENDATDSADDSSDSAGNTGDTGDDTEVVDAGVDGGLPADAVDASTSCGCVATGLSAAPRSLLELLVAAFVQGR